MPRVIGLKAVLCAANVWVQERTPRNNSLHVFTNLITATAFGAVAALNAGRIGEVRGEEVAIR
jgi:hypothetical protein